MKLTNRIARYYPDTVPAPRYRPPEPEPSSKWPWWFVVGFACGLAVAWIFGVGR